MTPCVKKVNIVKVQDEKKINASDYVVIESNYILSINNNQVAKFSCSPMEVEELVLGFLLSEGWINKYSDINNLSIDPKDNIIRVKITENQDLLLKFFNIKSVPIGCGDSSSLLTSGNTSKDSIKSTNLQIKASEITDLMKIFHAKSLIFKNTGGVHSAAICNSKEIIYFEEDIGRHNSIDKIIGKCFMNSIPLYDKILLSSGRIFKDTIEKCRTTGIPIIISRSAPSDCAIEIAINSNITLVGFARANRMNIYSHPQRIL